jgi:hypothetical protein
MPGADCHSHMLLEELSEPQTAPGILHMTKVEGAVMSGMTTAIVLAVRLMANYSVCTGADISARDLLEKIRYSERMIHDVQAEAHLFETDSGQRICDMEWRYSMGKECIVKDEWFGKQGETPPSTGIEAYDGHTHFAFRQNAGEHFSTGGLGPLNPLLFSAMDTPKSLLGYTIKKYSNETLSDMLIKCDDIHVIGDQKVDGHECYLIECKGIVDGLKGTSRYDVRIWIDPARDYRPLQIEKYYSPASMRGLNVKPPFSALRRRWSNISLENFGGTWFPVSGDVQIYKHEWVPPENMTKRQFSEKNPGLSADEYYQKMELSIVPDFPLRTIRLTNIHINRGIPETRFKIEFPPGCRVYDGFLQQGYVVGSSHRDIGSELESLNDTSAAATGAGSSKASQTDLAQASKRSNPVSGAGTQPLEEQLANASEADFPYLLIGGMIIIIVGASVLFVIIFRTQRKGV